MAVLSNDIIREIREVATAYEQNERERIERSNREFDVRNHQPANPRDAAPRRGANEAR